MAIRFGHARKKFLQTKCSKELRGRILDPEGRPLDGASDKNRCCQGMEKEPEKDMSAW